MPEGRRPRLSPVVAKARSALADALGPRDPHGPLLLVACSGGPDSLALAAATAFFVRRGDFRAGAVVIDHNLQPGSAQVAERAAASLRSLGLDPVQVRSVTVDDEGEGPEAAARSARYAALDAAAQDLGADAVLLGHTLDDQAETVLLGLARGSGARSLAGMPAARGRYLRPFLSLRREETLGICAAEGLDPWHDPTNADPAFTRSRVRTTVMPLLEKELGPGVAESLARTAAILTEDAAYLDAASAEIYAAVLREPPRAGAALELDAAGLRAAPAALRLRALALAAVASAGVQPSRERLLAVDALLNRKGAGEVQLPGRVSVWAAPGANRDDGQGRLVFISS
ncbi:tRNA lysidine(34) synthetase TilS [Paenarthrobacter sp. DKR-5]|uniref:tRNA lysidine(34) synthetase TilS n=1 Tax=Paenarthrobacter sp. DKR-5 TaxID=2835535 RepID=UPI001BDD9F90|nr:tRNA lysidine(34) synthetase TilS [Paenarthrobacter sp. DKR-5]MBT1003273.1 tRNA lysidine(34) synthetase TilS [Paenarthrobacter sp. DKR-5]